MQTWQNWAAPSQRPQTPAPNFQAAGGAINLHGGVLGATTPGSSDLSPWAYSFASLLGSAFGGGLIGGVASHDVDGVKKGAAFAAGLAGVTEGFSSYKDGARGLGLVLVVGGAGGMLWSLHSFWKHRR
jgi:hypothetical protein